MRDLQAKKATAKAYYASRAIRRPKIVHLEHAIAVPAPYKPISWAQAKLLGQAYVRVLEGLPPHPTEKEAEVIKKYNQKRAGARMARAKMRKAGKLQKKIRRDPHGEWWTSRFADLIERRRAGYAK